MAPAATASTDNPTDFGRVLAQRERRFAAALLAPAFLVICVLLAAEPRRWKELAVLGAVGMAMNVVFWRNGPWHFAGRSYWVLQGVAVILWIALLAIERGRARRGGGAHPAEAEVSAKPN